MKRIVIANHNMAMVDDILNLLDGMVVVSQKLSISYARNRADVLARAEAEAPDMVIADVDLAENKTSPKAPWVGLHLAEDLRIRFPDLPLVLISAFELLPEFAARVAALGNAALVLNGGDFDAGMKREVTHGFEVAATSQAQVAVSGVADPVRDTGPLRYLIEIHLRARGNCTYQARSLDKRVPFKTEPLPFKVKTAHLQELAALSTDLALASERSYVPAKKSQAERRWISDYRKLGNRLRAILLESNASVAKSIAWVTGRMEVHRANAQPALCFIVDEGVYPIALEAIRHGKNAKSAKYWLERAPLWRQLALPVGQYPLFQDSDTREKPINCLIVEANTSGPVPEWNLSFEDLPGVKEDADWLEQHLRDQKTVPIGRIGRIRYEAGQVVTTVTRDGRPEPVVAGGTTSFRIALRDLLTRGEPWHLVHYAGHTHYDKDNDWGYLLLPKAAPMAGEPPVPERVGTPEFAKWLEQTRFLYMSSCRGSSQDFVFNLCKNNVPAVAGFRWNIEDSLAGQHSHDFYEELFAKRSIEDALFETWNHTYGRDRGKRVWASSQLVMQLAA